MVQGVRVKAVQNVWQGVHLGHGTRRMGVVDRDGYKSERNNRELSSRARENAMENP